MGAGEPSAAGERTAPPAVEAERSEVAEVREIGNLEELRKLLRERRQSAVATPPLPGDLLGYRDPMSLEHLVAQAPRFAQPHDFDIDSNIPFLGPIVTAFKRAQRRLFRTYLQRQAGTNEYLITLAVTLASRQARDLDELRRSIGMYPVSADAADRQIEIGEDIYLVAHKAESSRVSLESLPPRRELPAEPLAAIAADMAQKTPRDGERLTRYLSFFHERKLVVDLACGRGEFLARALDEGISAIGFDRDPAHIRLCRDRGLQAVEGDPLDSLRRADVAGCDAILCSHVVEHFEPADVLRLFVTASELLPVGAPMVVRTTHPSAAAAGDAHFWADPTRVRPYPVELLRQLLTRAGFSVLDAGNEPLDPRNWP